MQENKSTVDEVNHIKTGDVVVYFLVHVCEKAWSQ